MAMRLAWAIIFFFIGTTAFAQVNPDASHRMHLKLSGNVPHPVSNKAFRRSFTGIYDLGLTYRIQLFSKFSFGVQGKHVAWTVPDNKIPGLDTYGKFNAVGLCLSYDHPVSETAVLYAAVTLGSAEMRYGDLSYDSVPADFQTKYRFNYGEVEVGAYFYTEGNFAIGLQTTMMFTNYAFDPYKLSLDEHKAYVASDLNGKVSQFNLGFSVIYSFLKKKGPVSN